MAAWPWHFRNFAKTSKSGEMFTHLALDSYIRTKRKERKARVLVLIIFRKGPGVLAARTWHFRNFAKTTKSGEMFTSL